MVTGTKYTFQCFVLSTTQNSKNTKENYYPPDFSNDSELLGIKIKFVLYSLKTGLKDRIITQS